VRYIIEIKIHCNYDKLIPLDEFVPHEMNTNRHPEKQIEVLAKLIKRNGVRLPIIISKLSSKCVSGHGRFDAFKLLGMEKIPVVYQDFEDIPAEYRFLESDNLIASFAEHDESKMLDNLKELDLDIASIDMEEFGLIDFNIPIDIADFNDDESSESEKEYKIEIKFPNDMEMMDIHDDLASRGYLVKIL